MSEQRDHDINRPAESDPPYHGDVPSFEDVSSTPRDQHFVKDHTPSLESDLSTDEGAASSGEDLPDAITDTPSVSDSGDAPLPVEEASSESDSSDEDETPSPTPLSAHEKRHARIRRSLSLQAALAAGYVTSTTQRIWFGLAERQWTAIAMILAVATAACARLRDLGVPAKIAFDETYYVKDAYSLWHLGYESEWPKHYDARFAAGDFSGMTTDPSFVVHPKVGKFLIGIGGEIFGWDNPFGWRIMPALAGILSVLLVCVIAHRLFRSPIVTFAAGMFVALDGVHVAVSRIALLDVFVCFFALLGVWMFIRDQEQWHQRLAIALRHTHDTGDKRERFSQWRPWLIGAAVSWGLACGVKWSGIYVIAVFGLYLALREFTMRYTGGQRGARLWINAIGRGGVPAFFQLVLPAFVVYLLTWLPWFTHSHAWGHGKAASLGIHAGPFAPLADWWIYHRDMMNFHTGVTSHHPYQANALQWLLDLRPTSMVWETYHEGTAHETVRAATALGNPLLWWLGLIAFFFIIIAALLFKDWRAGVIVTGYLGLWAPWLIYFHRTIFMFYTVALTPFVALALVYAIGVLLGEIDMTPTPLVAWEQRLIPARAKVPQALQITGLAIIVIVIAASVFFLPVVSSMEIPRSHWHWRMWLNSWI